MVNKKGIIRILEASAAMLIIFIVILTFSMTRKASTERDLSERITPLLEEIAKNNTMRDEIVKYDSITNPEANESIATFLKSRITEKNLGYEFRICEIGDICGMISGYPKDITGNVYAGSRIISSSLEVATPKRVSIFLWFKK